MKLNAGDKATMFHEGTNTYYEVVVQRAKSVEEMTAEFTVNGTFPVNEVIVTKPAERSTRHPTAAADFTKMAHLYGMKPEWLNKPFVWGRGKGLRVVGLLPNKHKNNVLVEGDQGGKYIMPPSDVIAALGRK